jgi:hypothetical protein
MQQNRRDFLGLLGLILLGPPLQPKGSPSNSCRGLVYHRSLRDLPHSISLDPGWCLEIDTLVERVDAPISEWKLSQTSTLRLATEWTGKSLEDVVSIFGARGVRSVCEFDYFIAKDSSRLMRYSAVVTVFENIALCRSVWHELAEIAEAAGLEERFGVGETMFVSRGGYSLPGKAYIRRGNVLASVLPLWIPDNDATGFAAKLDERISDFLQ